MEKFLNSLLDWIYKKRCYFCGASKESLKMCSDCFNTMDFLPYDSNRTFLGVNIYCAGVYENVLQKMIRGLKYHNQKDLAYFQAKFMYDYWRKIVDASDAFQVVPIPLFITREKKRKYNHMTLVAQEFCKLSGYELNLDLVKRTKDTRPQYKLNKSQRMDNLANAFKVDANSVKNGKILLLDDICTTGATFENVIMELKKSGLNDIVCFATTTPISGN